MSDSKKQPKKSGKILLVEDEKSLSDMYQTKFAKEGFEVFVLDNGGQVLETAKKEKPKVILLDIILPQENGFDVLEELKKESTTKNIPVIMLTNLGQSEDVSKGKKLGAVDYIIKADSTPAQIVEKIKEHI